MTKADKIENAMNWIIGVGVALMAIRALRAAAKRKADEDYYAGKNYDLVVIDRDFELKNDEEKLRFEK